VRLVVGIRQIAGAKAIQAAGESWAACDAEGRKDSDPNAGLGGVAVFIAVQGLGSGDEAPSP
jgi:hypothetical protein